METKWLTWLLRISYIEHETNELVGSKVAALLGHQKLFFVTMMREAAQTGLIRPRDSAGKLSKTVLRDTLEDMPTPRWTEKEVACKHKEVVWQDLLILALDRLLCLSSRTVRQLPAVNG